MRCCCCHWDFTVEFTADQLHSQSTSFTTHHRNNPEELSDDWRLEQIRLRPIIVHITNKNLENTMDTFNGIFKNILNTSWMLIQIIFKIFGECYIMGRNTTFKPLLYLFKMSILWLFYFLSCLHCIVSPFLQFFLNRWKSILRYVFKIMEVKWKKQTFNIYCNQPNPPKVEKNIHRQTEVWTKQN